MESQSHAGRAALGRVTPMHKPGHGSEAVSSKKKGAVLAAKKKTEGGNEGSVAPVALPAKRRQRQPEIIRAKILAAAFNAFANFGFEGTSMRTVASEAGVSLSLLLYHFGSKDELWKAVLTDILQRHPIGWNDLSPDGQPSSASDKLRHVIKRYVEVFADVPELYRLMTQEGHYLSERLLWLCDTFVKHEYAMLKELVIEGQAEGKVRVTSPGHLRFAIIAVAGLPFSMAAEYQYLTKRTPFSSKEIAATIELINRLVFLDEPSRTN